MHSRVPSLDNGERLKMKICSKCEISKPNKEFNKDKNRKDGLRCQCKECDKKYRKNNRDAIIQYNREYRRINKKEIENRRKIRLLKKSNYEKYKVKQKRAQDKRRSIIKNKISDNISLMVRQSLKRVSASKNGCHWETLVGYTIEKLKKHLESQFTEGMGWKNYGLYGWHIDHKKPISSFHFDSLKDREFKKCWALENLQPLWAKENLSKGAKLN